MRYDINILWIEDADTWQKGAQELFLEKCEDGLLINIDYIGKTDEVATLYKRIQTEANGYKIYDIMFIDFNISKNYNGDKIIEEFRKNNIDADILFYSDKLTEEAEKERIKSLNGDFNGIYLAKRADFQEKALMLYKKNSRKLTSILNIRGFLADKTSENDFVMNSYLLEEYDSLKEEDKKDISRQINSLLLKRIEDISKNLKKGKDLLKKSIHKIKDINDLPDFLFPISCRYQIFFNLLKLEEDKPFEDEQIIEYLETVIKNRNTVAHKKIDICRQHKYLKYYDTIRQYRTRRCPYDCKDHDNKNKISYEEWKELLKKTNEFSKKFDTILEKLSQKKD